VIPAKGPICCAAVAAQARSMTCTRLCSTTKKQTGNEHHLNTLMAQCCPAVANSSCFTLPSNNAMRVACIFEASRNGGATAVYHTPAKPCREEAVSTMITSEPSITSSAQQVVTAKHTLQHSGATWCSSGAHNPQIYPRLSTQDPAASGWGH
jgi:hypothetical protein